MEKPPAYSPSYQSTDQYPPSAPYPAAYPTKLQPPPYKLGAAQQQQQANTVVVANVVRTVVKHIALSLINLLFCCWPLGIVGLIYSLKVDSEFASGRYEEARRASDTAKSINYVGIGVGAVLTFVYIVVINVAVLAANSS